MLCIYWNIPQNDTRKLFLPVYERIDLHCLANKFRFHPLGPPPSICRRALLPAEFWDVWMAHSIKHVTLQVTFQTAPQASSITSTSTSQLAERGQLWRCSAVHAREDSLLLQLKATNDPDIKMYLFEMRFCGIGVGFQIYDALIDCADTTGKKMSHAALRVPGKPSAVRNLSVSLAGLLRLRRQHRLLPGPVVSRRCSAPAREFTPNILSAATQTNCFITLLPPRLLPLWVSLC